MLCHITIEKLDHTFAYYRFEKFYWIEKFVCTFAYYQIKKIRQKICLLLRTTKSKNSSYAFSYYYRKIGSYFEKFIALLRITIKLDMLNQKLDYTFAYQKLDLTFAYYWIEKISDTPSYISLILINNFFQII